MTKDASSAPRILVVDDRESNVRLLKSLLKREGYEVSAAYDGVEALDCVAQDPPDLVLLDVLMPKMNGFQVARALRANKETRAIPILMLTALKEVQDKIKALESGADDILSKPFYNVEVLARVRAFLRVKQLHDELQTKNALLERVLMRYISEDVALEILSDPDQNLQLGGQSCEVSVLFADIRGFTKFAEQRAPSQVTHVLNHIFNCLSPVIFEHHGTLDKYIGDAVMAFYGAPVPSLNNAAQAARTAWEMQEQFAQLRSENDAMSELGLGIGINTGEAVVGNVGSDQLMDYTVIGNTPNVAKRLQERALPGQILIGERSYQIIKGTMDVREIEPLHLKGISEPVRAYEVLNIKDLVV
ncbi:MAG: response regulator [Chloroflexi bacterium]|nr:response regulator [Chloroflexota bacterium]